MAVYPNKYAKNCNGRGCGRHVAVGEGFIQKVDGGWVTWCKDCCPERIVPAAARPAPQRILNAQGHVLTPYEPDNLPLVRSFPGARFHGNKGICPVCNIHHPAPFWAVSLAEADRARVLEIADQLKLDVAPELRTVVVTEQAQNATVAGLYPYQVTGVNWLSKQNFALLGDEMGLGKTIQSVVSLEPQARVLVIAPNGLKYNWLDEVQKWRPADYTCTVINGGANFRTPRPGEILVVNFECLPDFLLEPAKPVARPKHTNDYAANDQAIKAFYEILHLQHPDLCACHVIVDEVHKCKGLDTQRGIKVRTLTHICKSAWGLTGTPLLNKAMDLWGVLVNMNLEKRAFGNAQGEWAFANFKRDFNCTKEEIWAGKRNGHRTVLRWGEPSPSVPEKLRRVMLQRKRAVVLPDLPKKTYTEVLVSLDDVPGASHIKKELDSLYEEWGTLMDVKEVLPPFTRFSAMLEALARACVPALLEYVENCEEQDVGLVVASAHLAPLDALLGRDGWAVISGDTPPVDRVAICNAQRAGKLKGVGCSIQAAGVGLNLTGSSRMLFVDLDWVPANNWQMEDRICIVEGQRVHTRRGFIPVEEVMVGDEVLTHAGHWDKVVAVSSREHRKWITEIEYTRYAADNLRTTHDHRLLVRRQDTGKTEWVKAHEVMPGDFLLFPRDKSEIDTKNIAYPMDKRLPQTKKGSGRRKLMPENVEISSDFLAMLGWYLAEGFCSIRPGKGRFVSFSAHEEERWFLNKLADYLLREFKINSSIYTKKDGKGLEMRTFSADLAYFLMDLVGSGSDNKVIPPVIMNLPVERLTPLLAAYVGGDGYSRNRQHEWTSVSPTLAAQICVLTAKCGHSPCMRRKSDTGAWVGSITVEGQPDSPSLEMADERYVYNPVRAVTTRFAPRGTRVHDLQVEGDESFVVGFAAVHNCRIGQLDNKCEIVRFVIDHPLCRHIHKLLAKKIALIAAAIDGKVEAKVPQVKAEQRGESQEEYDARMERARQAELEYDRQQAEKEAAQAKIVGKAKAKVVLEREQQRAKGTPRSILPLTPARIEAVRRAFKYMLSVCDGAVAKDWTGFNRPDAVVAHVVLHSGLEEQDEVNAAYWMLTRYRRQLFEQEPLLFTQK